MTLSILSADSVINHHTAAAVIEFGVKVQCHNKNNNIPISRARNILLIALLLVSDNSRILSEFRGALIVVHQFGM